MARPLCDAPVEAARLRAFFARRRVAATAKHELEPLMRSLFVTMFVTFLLFGYSKNARAESASNLVHASLLADVSTVKPGEPFTVGVLLKIKADWHVYWTNPGDAGLPTRVQWVLPPGYTASELRFPVPRHIDQPGGLVIYGYTDEVMLTATVTPPNESENVSAGTGSTAVPITAKVSWLCCSENCVPGKATLNLELVRGEKSVPDNTELFQQWQDRLPTIVPALAAPLVLTDSPPHTQIFTTRKITDPKLIIPGAADGLILTLGPPQATAAGTTIALSAQILKGQNVSANSVPILVTWADPDGKARPDDRLGEQIDVPIVSGR